MKEYDVNREDKCSLQYKLCFFSFENKHMTKDIVKTRFTQCVDDIFFKLEKKIFFLKKITDCLVSIESSVNVLKYIFCIYVKPKNFFHYNIIVKIKYLSLYKNTLHVSSLFFVLTGKKLHKFLINIKFKKKNTTTKEVRKNMEKEKQDTVFVRPPIVSVLGHVNHGKTTLLDTIKKSLIAKNEFDGITQHLSSYVVVCPQGKLTFLDTPGHAAFNSIRELSLKFTDIVLLVIAVDDGLMPQTVEILKHLQYLSLSVIVVLNKIDKCVDTTNVDSIIQNITKFGIVSETLGGENIFVKISAKTGFGVDNLLNMLCLQGEILELKSKLNCTPKGGIIETKVNKGLGIVVTVIILEGVLQPGFFFVSGSTFGKIRFILDTTGKKIRKAYPSTPCDIIGLNTTPVVGDTFEVVKDEKTAKKIILERCTEKQVVVCNKTKRIEDLFEEESTKNKICIVLKVDTFGSLEPIIKSISESCLHSAIDLKITKKGVGDVSESDIDFALYTKSIVIGFNVKIDAVSKRKAQKDNVAFYFFNSIYNIVDFFDALIKKNTENNEKKNSVIGTAVVRSIFDVTKTKKIAGCYVEKGSVKRNLKVTLSRKEIVIYEGSIESLNYFKKSVLEVIAKRECGIIFDNFNNFDIGDIITVLKTDDA